MLATRFFGILSLALTITTNLLCYSNITPNDPYPMFSARYPYDFLTTSYREYLKGNLPDNKNTYFSASVSPFFQSAGDGKNYENKRVALGDLHGRWNMLAIFYDPAVRNKLGRDLHLDIITTSTTNPENCLSLLTTPTTTDPNHEFGFLSVPIKYRKYGGRVELDFRAACDWGLKIQTGFVDLKQTVSFVDRTCAAQGKICDCHTQADGDCTAITNSQCDITQFQCPCKREIMTQIMARNQRKAIAKALGLNIESSCNQGMEDLYFTLYWRKVIPVNQKLEDWPYFLFMPFAAFEAIAPTSKEVNPNCLFTLPTGNNGHAGLGFSAGLNFDFVETLEFGVQGSMTYFLKRNYFDAPVPTQELQMGMFPYKADYTMRPGVNWTISALINAYHFLDRLSVYAQFVAVGHCASKFWNTADEDLPIVAHRFDSSNPNEVIPEVQLCKMVEMSKWQSHVINVGFTYDISPNVALGFLWQAPVYQKSAYRATTLLGSVIVTI